MAIGVASTRGVGSANRQPFRRTELPRKGSCFLQGWAASSALSEDACSTACHPFAHAPDPILPTAAVTTQTAQSRGVTFVALP